MLAAFLPYRLSVTSNRVSEMIASRYRALFNLSVPEWRIIAITTENGPVSQQAICNLTYMDKVTVSRAAIALVERGLLARHPNPDDKRSHLLGLTTAGRELYQAIAPRALDMESRIFATLSVKDRERLKSLLSQIDVAIDAQLDALG
jgi:DNA-binding MarR family transcriptional regulator